MARLHLRARFGLALAAVTFSIAGRTYKMADPCILLWFIYLFLLKKRIRRKYRIKFVLQMSRRCFILLQHCLAFRVIPTSDKAAETLP